MAEQRLYTAEIIIPEAASPSLIARVDPGYPGHDLGLINDMGINEAELYSLPQTYLMFYRIETDGYYFEQVQLGRPRNNRCQRLSIVDPPDFYEINTNPDFSKWAVLEKPDRWLTEGTDATSYIEKDYQNGEPLAATFVCDGTRDVELVFRNVFPRVSLAPPWNSANRQYYVDVEITVGSDLEVYANVDGIGDLNGGAPINASATTFSSGFACVAGSDPGAFRLIARPGGAPGVAAIEGVSLREGGNKLVRVVADEWAANAGGGVSGVPVAYPPRYNSTGYSVGDRVYFNFRQYDCVQAGTTGSTLPDWDSGNGTTDGGVIWDLVDSYHNPGIMVNPDLVDVFSAGNTVQRIPPGGGPDIWGEVQSSLTYTSTTDAFFVDLPAPLVYEVTGVQVTEASMQITQPVSGIPTSSVDNTWHTVLAIIKWTPAKPPSAKIEIQADLVPQITITIMPDGVQHSVVNNVPANVAEAFVAGTPLMLAPDIYAYWVCYRFSAGAFPSGVGFMRFRFYPGGGDAGSFGTGCAPLCLQDALGVKGPYWPATTPYDLSPTFHEGDRLKLDLTDSRRDESSKFDPRRGSLFLMATPIRNEIPGAAIAPPNNEALVGVGLDTLFGIDTDNYVYASQGQSRQYLTRGPSVITSAPPEYFVLTWDGYANRMQIYSAGARPGVTTSYEKAEESGVIRFDGDGTVLELSQKIYRAWHIHHVSIFDRALDESTILGMLP